MSYGQNAPWGFMPVRTKTDATWNGKLDGNYYIQSGYAQNIFTGDPIFVGTDGFVRNLYDASANAFTAATIFGIFAGCSYEVPTSVNPIDPGSPGRPYWPANTATLGGVNAKAFIITDPSVVFNMQVTGNVGATQANVGGFANIAYTTSGGLVQGNSTTGQSSVSLNIGTFAAGNVAANTASPGIAVFNCYIDSLARNPQNVSGQQYNNVEVLIANHYFRPMFTHAI
jgi:hypothetical protein